jgi:superfamily I DNA/RNA helicase
MIGKLEKMLESIRSHDSQPFFSRPANEEEKAIEIVKKIKENQQKGLQLLKHIVLYRSHSNSWAIVDELVRKEIPFIVHGKQNNFYESSFINPVLDMLRLSLNPSDKKAIIGASTIFYLRKEFAMKSLEALSQNPYLAERFAENKGK